VARVTNTVSTFGGFFDSVIDRYSDLALYFGLLVYYARVNRFFYVVLTALAMTGSVMVSYVRARAESLIESAKWASWSARASGTADHRSRLRPDGSGPSG